MSAGRLNNDLWQLENTQTKNLMADASPRKVSSQSRNPQLDRLRAVAALLVIGVHLHYHASPGGFLSVIETGLRRTGLVGVDLFFVLSGFLIGTLLLTEMNDHTRINVPRFIIRRGFKLYPVYYVFIAYSLTREVMKACHGGVIFHTAFGDSLREFLPTMFFVQNYIPPNPAAHTWSLAVEEHFYLTLPLVLALLGPKRVWKWLIPIGLATVPVCLILRVISVLRQGSGENVQSGLEFDMAYTHLHVDALMVGVVLAAVALKFPDLFLTLGRFPKTLVRGWGRALVGGDSSAARALLLGHARIHAANRRQRRHSAGCLRVGRAAFRAERRGAGLDRAQLLRDLCVAHHGLGDDRERFGWIFDGPRPQRQSPLDSHNPRDHDIVRAGWILRDATG